LFEPERKRPGVPSERRTGEKRVNPYPVGKVPHYGVGPLYNPLVRVGGKEKGQGGKRGE